MKRLNAVSHKWARDVNEQFPGRRLAQGHTALRGQSGAKSRPSDLVCQGGEWNVILITQKFLGLSLLL